MWVRRDLTVSEDGRLLMLVSKKVIYFSNHVFGTREEVDCIRMDRKWSRKNIESKSGAKVLFPEERLRIFSGQSYSLIFCIAICFVGSIKTNSEAKSMVGNYYYLAEMPPSAKRKCIFYYINFYSVFQRFSRKTAPLIPFFRGVGETMVQQL